MSNCCFCLLLICNSFIFSCSFVISLRMSSIGWLFCKYWIWDAISIFIMCFSSYACRSNTCWSRACLLKSMMGGFWFYAAVSSWLWMAKGLIFDNEMLLSLMLSRDPSWKMSAPSWEKKKAELPFSNCLILLISIIAWGGSRMKRERSSKRFLSECSFILFKLKPWESWSCIWSWNSHDWSRFSPSEESIRLLYLRMLWCISFLS